MKKLISLEKQLIAMFLSFALLFSSAASAIAQISPDVLSANKHSMTPEETLEALRAFYYVAVDSEDIKRTVWAMHEYAAKASSHPARNTDLKTDMVTQVAETGKKAKLGLQPSLDEVDDLVKAWSSGQLELENLVEYMDPLPPHSARNEEIAAAAAILFSYVYSVNRGDILVNKDNFSWFLWRAQYRGFHAATSGRISSAQFAGSARIYLNLFLRESLEFLHKNRDYVLEEDEKQVKDILKSKLEEYLRKSKVPQGLLETPLIRVYNSKVNIEDIPAAVTYSWVLNEGEGLSAIGSNSANLGNDNFKSGETPAELFFGTIYANLLTFPSSAKIYDNIKKVLENAVMPDKSIAYRVEALALASMLTQMARNGTIKASQKTNRPSFKVNVSSIFAEESFRKDMAEEAAGIYARITPGNGKDKNLFGSPEITRYGLSATEVQNLADRLAYLFETFLPLDEPYYPNTKDGEGDYEGCHNLPDYSKKSSKKLDVLPRGSVSGYSKSNKPCKDADPNGWFGKATVLAREDSKTLRVIGMERYHSFGTFYERQDLAVEILGEVAEWYLWAGAFQLLEKAWIGLRAFTAATKAARKAEQGAKAARFSKKYRQAYKYYSGAMKAEREATTLARENLKPKSKPIVLKNTLTGKKLEVPGKFKQKTLAELEKEAQALRKQGKVAEAKKIEDFVTDAKKFGIKPKQRLSGFDSKGSGPIKKADPSAPAVGRAQFNSASQQYKNRLSAQDQKLVEAFEKRATDGEIEAWNKLCEIRGSNRFPSDEVNKAFLDRVQKSLLSDEFRGNPANLRKLNNFAEKVRKLEGYKVDGQFWKIYAGDTELTIAEIENRKIIDVLTKIDKGAWNLGCEVSIPQTGLVNDILYWAKGKYGQLKLAIKPGGTNAATYNAQLKSIIQEVRRRYPNAKSVKVRLGEHELGNGGVNLMNPNELHMHIEVMTEDGLLMNNTLFMDIRNIRTTKGSKTLLVDELKYLEQRSGDLSDITDVINKAGKLKAKDLNAAEKAAIRQQTKAAKQQLSVLEQEVKQAKTDINTTFGQEIPVKQLDDLLDGINKIKGMDNYNLVAP